MYFCNLNARFAPIFLKITLIPHLLMFCWNRKNQAKKREKRARKKNLPRSTASSRQSGSLRQRNSFVEAKLKTGEKKRSQVRLGEAGLREVK